MRVLVGLLVSMTLLLPSVGRAAWQEPVRGENGMAVTAHPAATRAAAEILEAGGNAVDAAVAAAFALAVVEPYSSGLGGGGFMLVHRALDAETVALDFREQAPLGATRDMYVRAGRFIPELSRDGWLAVGTPGAVAGYLHALERWGTLPRARVMAPAIRLAREGFEVGRRYQFLAEMRLEVLRRDPEATRLFLVPGPAGGPPVVPPRGHLVKQPELARTLEAIAKDGASAFYSGDVARKIVAGSEAGGGVLTLEDLASYRPTERKPIVGTYKGYTLHAMPPPSSGGVALVETLNILSRYDLARDGWHAPRPLHLLVEALRRTFADRNTHLGDPAFVKNPVEALTSLSYANEKRVRIDPLRATPSSEVVPYQVPEGDKGNDTSHLSVVDAAGNAVALTTTVNYGWGACVVAPGTGVVMNDEMDDFAGQPGASNAYGLVQLEANAVAPRKVPLSSMSPTIVFKQVGEKKKLHMVLGAPGGPTIITTVLQVFLNVVHYGMDLGQAVGAPRIHHQWLPDTIFVEPLGMEPATRAALEALGHKVTERPHWGNAQCILVDPETELLWGASDPRGEGLAEGL